MPTAGISNPQGAYGQPLFAQDGLNEQLLVEVVNNTGGPLVQGMVMCWDILTAASAVASILFASAATGTVATQTLTVASSTASFAQKIATITNVKYATTGIGVLNGYVGPMAMVHDSVSGSTFTNAYLPYATATNGLQTTSAVYESPQAAVQQGVGLPAIATASDAGRYVTFSSLTSTTLLAKDPLVCGVVSPTGDAGTNATIIQPGAPFLMCVGGIARVNVSGATVAANAAICTAAGVVGAADDATPTLGNQLGTSLEANTAKDTNNTIRAIIKLA